MPIMRQTNFFLNTLEEGLNVKECNHCEGQWSSSRDYWFWLEHHEQLETDSSYSDIDFELEDSKKAKICPDCGRILIKFRVGHGINFRLDHCNSCNGVWFDKNEWKVLKSRNLHEEIHSIFTTEWQNQIQKEERAKHFEESYIQKLGQDYPKIKEFKEWLDDHRRRSSILAFLSDANPFE